MNMLTKRARSLFALFWLAATSTAVMAQQTESIAQITSAANNGTDKSMSVLQMVFGSIVTNPLSGGGSGGMLAHVFLVMNVCILGVGAIWAMYHFGSAIIATGAEGEFLGQKKSSPWYVIRMGGGFSMLVPVFGGYSGAQAIMLWAAMLGVGIANLSLDAATGVLASGGSMLSSPTAPEVTTLSKALYEANLCAQAANQALSNLPDDAGVSADASEKFSAVTATGKIVLMNQNGLSCGGAQINAAPSASAATPPDDASGTGLAAYAPNTSGISSSLPSAQQSALTAMQVTLSSAAASYVKAADSGEQPEDPQQTINNAAQAYQQSIQSAISAAGSSISDVGTTVRSNLARDGWIMLGAWYQSFAMANSQLTTMAKSSATGVPPTSLDNLPYPELYRAVMATYSQQIQQDASTSTANSSPSAASGSPPAATNLFKSTTDPQGILTGLVPGRALVNKVISLTSSAGQSGSNGGTGINPLIGMKNLGDTILDSGWTLLAGYAAAKGFEAATDSTLGKVVSTALNVGSGGVSGAVMTAIKGVLDALGPLILMLAIALFFFGVMLSVYLPMLPFIIWFGGITSWFVIVCESVVASPLWAFAHLDGDGEGLGQRTTHGYIFLLNLMFRPVSMVIGFILASMGIVAMGTLLNTMFGVAMQNAQFGSVTGIVSIVAFIVLYAGMCQTLCSGLFSMIHVIPDQMFSWIGGQISARVGQDLHDKSKDHLGAGVRHASQAASPLGRGTPEVRSMGPSVPPAPTLDP